VCRGGWGGVGGAGEGGGDATSTGHASDQYWSVIVTSTGHARDQYYFDC